MKSRTHGAQTIWTLDGDTITVFIPVTWKRRGGQKVIIAPTAAMHERRQSRGRTRL